MKYYVVADIHGFFSALKTALTEKGFFEDTEPHKLVVCGDLFDRGKEAVELQKFIVDLMEKDEVILVRGNHEDLMVNLLDEAYRWMTETVVFTHHWSNGTVDTALRLTDMGLEEAIVSPKTMVTRMENTPFLKKILPAMVDYFETEHYIFVHGWIPCNATRYFGGSTYFTAKENWREATAKEWEMARWYNGMDAANQEVTEPNKTIICGHWHCSYGHAELEGKGSERGKDADYSPYYGDGIIAIDGCVALSRKINCIVLED